MSIISVNPTTSLLAVNSDMYRLSKAISSGNIDAIIQIRSSCTIKDLDAHCYALAVTKGMRKIIVWLDGVSKRRGRRRLRNIALRVHRDRLAVWIENRYNLDHVTYVKLREDRKPLITDYSATLTLDDKLNFFAQDKYELLDMFTQDVEFYTTMEAIGALRTSGESDRKIRFIYERTPCIFDTLTIFKYAVLVNAIGALAWMITEGITHDVNMLKSFQIDELRELGITV